MVVKKMADKKIKAVLTIGMILVLLLIFNPAHAFEEGGEGCGAECVQCHKIDQKEAADILKGFVDKVLSVEEGSVKGVWEVEVEARGNKFSIYLHYSKKYFFAGNIIDIENKKVINKIAQPVQRAKVEVEKIPLEDAIVIGSPSAENRVIVFDDPDCPYCRKLHTEIKKVVSERKDIAFYIKLFPLTKLHPDAYNKSKAIVCKKSSKLLDDAFSGKEIPLPECETTQIDENIRLAERLGIKSTPTLILKDGTVIPGYMEADKLIAVIDSVKMK
jgi:thiol:disulfide interchange protein DsbC